MGQDTPPRYSDGAPSKSYIPQFSQEQSLFLQLVHRFAAVKPLSLRIFLDLVSEDEALLSTQFPDAQPEVLVQAVEELLSNVAFKPLLFSHLAKEDYSAALITVLTLMEVSWASVLRPTASQAPVSSTGTSTHQQQQTNIALSDNEKPPDPTEAVLNEEFSPKFSPEQKAFLDLVQRFALVRPLSLRIFLDLFCEDDEILSTGFPDQPRETVAAEIAGILTNSTLKTILSAHLSKHDYPAALITVMALLSASTSHPTLEETGFGIVQPTNFRAGAPENRREGVVRLRGMIPQGSRQLLRTLPSASMIYRNPGVSQQGVPLQQLTDTYSLGLYHLYELLWVQQGDVTISCTAMVPNFPYGYINFEQSAPTATLPSSFGSHPVSYPYDILQIPDDSDATFPANERSLKKILIRACYRDVYKELEADGHHATVLGQPGAGKSCLFAYILAERLRKRQPTILQLDEEDIYSFSEYGAVRFPPNISPEEAMLRNAWYLVDCSEHMQTLPNVPSPIYRVPSLKVVLAVSPHSDSHWSWGKKVAAKRFWIYCHSWDEFYAIRCIDLNYLIVDDEKWAFSYLKYGANARACFLAASSQVHDADQLRYLNGEIARHPTFNFQGTTASPPLLYAIFPKLNQPSDSIVVPASLYVLERLLQRLNHSIYHSELQLCWNTIRSFPHMFQTWGLRSLYTHLLQSKMAVMQSQPQSPQLTLSVSGLQKLSDFQAVNGTSYPSSVFFMPEKHSFISDAVIIDQANQRSWLVLFTSGEDRAVDAKALAESLSVQVQVQVYVQNYRGSYMQTQEAPWCFLLVVPETCTDVENVRIDIRDNDIWETVPAIPTYILRL